MERFVILPRNGEPPCSCGATRVAVYRDGIEGLMDNMGCDLGLELVAGPLCPRCHAADLELYQPVAPPRPDRRSD